MPPGLRGTLYRNGPAHHGGAGVGRHYFDGDGALSAVRIAGGEAEGAVRLIETPGLLAERARGRRDLPSFGTPAPSWWRRVGGRIKNAANTSVLPWSGRMLALFEAGLPVEVSPEDLATIGETDLEGLIPETFSAHPHRVPARRATYNFGVRFGVRSWIDIFELPDNGPATRLASVPLGSPRFVHDFIATEKHLIFFIPPVRFRALRQFLGMGCALDNMQWRPEDGTEVLIVPIDTPKKVVRFRVDPFWMWHFANAFEAGNEIVVDFIHFEDAASIDGLRASNFERPSVPMGGSLQRARIGLAEKSFKLERSYTSACEFPQVTQAQSGRPTRTVFLAANTPGTEHRPLDRLACVDVESGNATEVSLGGGTYVSEPIVTPGNDGEGGYVLSLVYDESTHRSYLAVLDAHRLGDGPLAKVWFD
ncbi:MAG: carotenoid oxygenase family protein, partial [Planctomycetota bacterium]